MKYRTDSPMVGAERMAYRQHSHQPMTTINHDQPESLESRRKELGALLRSAVQSVAASLVRRSWYTRGRAESDRQFLHDTARGRNAASDKTMARLLVLQDGHELSERIYQIERAGRPAPCLKEASLTETQANGPLNEVQEKLIADPTNTAYLEAAYEYALKQIAATREYVHALTHRMEKVS
jgi:hypothetical protein